jgi:hypothetical protein
MELILTLIAAFSFLIACVVADAMGYRSGDDDF